MDSLILQIPEPPPAHVEETEEQVRQDLACAYRLIAHLGMTDTVYTHLSVRVPGPGNFFLVNPYGLMFDEITASSLVKVDADGAPAQATSFPVNPAGFVIHSAIHMKRHDAHCVMHTHTLAGMTVAAQTGGLLPLNQIGMEFIDEVAIHEYEGVADDDNLSERERLVRDLGDKPCLLLRNHGLLTVGRTIAEAFYFMYYLEMACRIQVSAQSTGAPLAIPSAETQQRTKKQFTRGTDHGWLVWQAFQRKMDREQPDYRS
ncbi:class II aldolase/adducin family protein [Acidisoma cellulosilytica]|uniref:Class II aldolase/adducin family protein n=1 Tax=Acidisoma cellulosilyticum TaxID=2802395 RepID=A0A963Z635_9PROT|nr:class II aldolase/adducin family protein [Acidisoma cellulosilyticum]MCB8883303.1 class II aldolase/adducin family protein [Acidisoma cellulosilyticum]